MTLTKRGLFRRLQRRYLQRMEETENMGAPYWLARSSNAKSTNAVRFDRLKIAVMLVTKRPAMISWRAKGVLVLVNLGDYIKPATAQWKRAEEIADQLNSMMEYLTPQALLAIAQQPDNNLSPSVCAALIEAHARGRI